MNSKTYNYERNSLLFYVGQAFLLAGSIFGLSYYVDKLTAKM